MESARSLPILEIKNHNRRLYSELPQALVNSPVTAAAMLDSISLFELMGSKWMLAVPLSRWDEEIHEHCFDEVRHTKMVQDGAKKLRWSMTSEQILLENELNKIFYQTTEAYLSQLSRKIFKLTYLGNRNKQFSLSAYAILAFLIERRIMKIYPSLAKHGPNEEIRILAKQIIKDERKHLGFVDEKLQASLDQLQTDQKTIIDLEESLADTWMEKLTYAVANN
ncbi:MAG: hypothetical protein KDD61_03360 [Bdellovibrionales bacterium]|nr:hypothetical protein [Bdellovibrionales bacterium]